MNGESKRWSFRRYYLHRSAHQHISFNLSVFIIILRVCPGWLEKSTKNLEAWALGDLLSRNYYIWVTIFIVLDLFSFLFFFFFFLRYHGACVVSLTPPLGPMGPCRSLDWNFWMFHVFMYTLFYWPVLVPWPLFPSRLTPPPSPHFLRTIFLYVGRKPHHFLDFKMGNLGVGGGCCLI